MFCTKLMDSTWYAAHTHWHRQTMRQQSTLACTDMQLISRAQQFAQTGSPTSRSQSCAHRQATLQQSKGCAYRQAAQ